MEKDLVMVRSDEYRIKDLHKCLKVLKSLMPGLNASLIRFSKEKDGAVVSRTSARVFIRSGLAVRPTSLKNTKSSHFFFDMFGFLENGPYKCY